MYEGQSVKDVIDEVQKEQKLSEQNLKELERVLTEQLKNKEYEWELILFFFNIYFH